MKRSNLDEMQEQKLLKIEHNGCWLAFYGLLAALVLQVILGQEEHVLGEWVLFMTLALYLGLDCMRSGIWSRSLQMSWKTNLLASLIAGLCVGAVMAAYTYLRYQKPYGSLAAGGICAGACFVVTLALLTVSMHLTKKRQKELNEEPEED